MADRRYQQQEWLREQYIDNDKTTSEIAEMCGVHQSTVSSQLQKYDITKSQVQYPRLQNEDWMYEQFVEQNRSIQSVADAVGCHRSTVLRWKRRTDFHDSHSEHDQLNDPEWLRKQITEDKQTVRDIAKTVGCEPSTVIGALREHGIDERVGQYHNRSVGKQQFIDSGGFNETPYRQQNWYDKAALRRAYWEYFWSVDEIAEWCGTTSGVMSDAFNELGIQTRLAGDTMKAKHLFRDNEPMPQSSYFQFDKNEDSYSRRDALTAGEVIDVLYVETADERDDTFADPERRTWSEVVGDD